MSDSWQLRLYEDRKLLYTAELTGPAELGRQSAPDEALYSQRPAPVGRRVVIALKDEKSIPRRCVLIEPLAEGGFRLTNLSAQRPLGLPDDATDLKPNASAAVSANALLALGKKTVRLQKTDGQRPALRGLADATAPPGRSAYATVPPAGAAMRDLVPWLQAAMDVLQSAAGSADFFDKAARAVVDLVNLDSGRVLLLKEDEWRPHAIHTAPRTVRDTSGPASNHVLNRVRQEKRTLWEAPDSSLPDAASLEAVEAVVAAPILDRNGTVIGALYGDRRQGGGSASAGPITEMEGMLVELLARGVAAGLARLEQEQAAAALRVQFEQFFSPELARHLARQPDLLKGRDAEVSILFCDIRGFSRISERLGPAQTLEWIGDVMETLSGCVRAEGGVLVDYIGDELMTMWGAPDEQPDHARRACRAALAMLARLPELNERWQEVLKEPMGIGVGVNTGPARVGNTGSRHKFKYGPLGNTVNLASRVQGATKYLKCKLLITGATQAKLDDGFATRRLCRVRVVNIAEPVSLYELVPDDSAGWPEAKAEYEKALEEFESRRFSAAARILGNWRLEHPGDGPALLLLSRAVQCMVEEPAPFDPVWILPGK